MPAERRERFVVEGGVLGLDREALQGILSAVLEKGVPFRFEARGHSMHPFIRNRDVVTVSLLPERPLCAGEIVAFRHPVSGGLVLHRIRDVRPDGLLVQGDNTEAPDAVIGDGDLIGLVTRAERNGAEVYRGDGPPDVSDRLAWFSRLWLHRIARHLTAMASQRLQPAANPVTPAGQSYSSRQPLFELPLLQPDKSKRVPREFDLEVTARCNCDCRHCTIALPAADRAAKAAELSLPEIERIAGEAVELGALWCLLTGGEPLLREDFADIYLALKRKGLLVSVFTNATLVGPAHVSLFQKYPPRDIEVTVYGATEATYERVTRRPGSYAAFRRGLDLLLGGGIKVRLKAMAMRSNAHELPEIARFCRQHTKDYFRFDPLLTLRLDRDASRNQVIQAERLSPEEIVQLERDDPERSDALRKACDKLTGVGCEPAACNHVISCGAGCTSFAVGADGTFRLCQPLCHPDTTVNLRRSTLRQAWEELVPRVRDIRSQRAEFLDKCRRCPLVNLCQWCPAHAHLETGELDSCPDYFCQVAHARAHAIKP